MISLFLCRAECQMCHEKRLAGIIIIIIIIIINIYCAWSYLFVACLLYWGKGINYRNLTPTSKRQYVQNSLLMTHQCDHQVIIAYFIFRT